MKLFWCCVVATTALITTVTSAAVNVERTVQQVQSILQANSLLPRLSREEIIQLLNDIRAEDAKSTSESKEKPKEVKVITTTPYINDAENEINPVTHVPNFKENVVTNEKDFAVSASAPTRNAVETTTRKNEPTVMVVLPYTPRDGSSLQELYTRPPRVQVVPAANVTPKPIKPAKETDAQSANKKKQDLPADLQAFLDAHGLKGNVGLDHFLLPLEGFKPLPPAKVVDGSVQLPENILLTYDLISPNSEPHHKNKAQTPSQNDFLYKPLRPEFPLELDTSSSETKETYLPLDLPKKKTKSNNTLRKPNYEPIDYDSVQVIPLKSGPRPTDEKVVLQNYLIKRQTNTSSNVTANNNTSTEVKTETSSVANDAREASTNPPPVVDAAASNTDMGASIADLEDSFGGALPEKPSPPPKKNGFYWMFDWNSFLEVGDGDTKVNIRFEPKLGDPQMFLPVNVP